MGAEETATKTKCFNIPFSHAMCVSVYVYIYIDIRTQMYCIIYTYDLSFSRSSTPGS